MLVRCHLLAALLDWQNAGVRGGLHRELLRGCGLLTNIFTAAEDRLILDGRAAGLSWLVIGTRIGATERACQYRLSRGLQVPDPKPVQVGRSKPRHPPEEKQKRDAMPAVPMRPGGRSRPARCWMGGVTDERALCDRLMG